MVWPWVRNGMALGTKWYGTRAHSHRYEMTRNREDLLVDLLHVHVDYIHVLKAKLNLLVGL